MRRRATYFTLLTAFAFSIPAQADAGFDYPVAKRGTDKDIYHEQEVHDPYRWLEDMSAEQTLRYVDAQEALLNDFVTATSDRDLMEASILELSALDAYSSPLATDSGYVFALTEAGRAQPVVYTQRALDADPRPLIDILSEYPDGSSLAGVSPAPTGEYVAYGVSQGQSRWRTFRIRNAASGDDLPDVLTGLHALGGPVAWLRSGDGFFYSRFETPAPGQELSAALGASQVWFHQIGTPQSRDMLIFERPDHPESLYSLAVTNDDAWLVISAYEGGDNRTEVFYGGLHDEGGVKILPLIPEADAIYTFLGSVGSRFWFYTTQAAPNGRIIAIDLDNPGRGDWIEIVPEAGETIAGGSAVGGNAISQVKDALLIMYLRDSRPLVRAFRLDGEPMYELEIPGVGTIWGGFAGRPESGEVFYSYLSLIDPNVIYRLDVEKGVSEVFKRPDLPFDPDRYVTTHTFYQSGDGTRVPIFVTHRKDIELNGNNPAFMYAYGAYGWVAFPWYQPHVMAWLEKGGVYALPGIRGGGEYGEAWHEAGARRNKQNGVDDYVAAAEWLVESGYTSPSLMVANGGSASGMLAAAAVMQRPDLFGAAVIDIPALDLLRYEQLSISRAWVDELGSVSDPGDFEALRAYSPYHNVLPERCYPPVLIIVGEKDETVLPAHGYKFVAAMQNAQACNHPVMLKVVRGAGHSFGTTPQQSARTWADAWTFVTRAMAGEP